jgi:hypothetical protein
MPDFDPVTLSIIANDGTTLIEQAVPFELKMSSRDVLERAFVILQTTASADPFFFTLQYYGYSEDAQLPGYLGYEIESFAKSGVNYPNNAQFYWDLIVDGITSMSGADTSYPNPGGTVLWQYTAMPSATTAPNKRAALFQSRQT